MVRIVLTSHGAAMVAPGRRDKTMKRISVENMRSSNGNEVPNQFLIRTEDGIYFQSYSTVIAFRDFTGKVKLDKESWDYSRTTAKYRNQFLRETKKETEQKIKNGTYELTDLNG
jgi:hypothetical protein